MDMSRLASDERKQMLRGRILQVLYVEKDKYRQGRRWKHSARFIQNLLQHCGFDYTEGDVRLQLGFLETAGYVESEMAPRGGPFPATELWCISSLGVKLHDREIAPDPRIEFDRPDEEG